MNKSNNSRIYLQYEKIKHLECLSTNLQHCSSPLVRFCRGPWVKVIGVRVGKKREEKRNIEKKKESERKEKKESLF